MKNKYLNKAAMFDMRSIKSLSELALPEKHRQYLQRLLDYLKDYPKIEQVLLFGSCATGKARERSDIDLFLLGAEITDDDEWEIVWNIPEWEDLPYVPCDILSGSRASFDEMAQVYGMVQCIVKKQGVDLSGLLRTC